MSVSTKISVVDYLSTLVLSYMWWLPAKLTLWVVKGIWLVRDTLIDGMDTFTVNSYFNKVMDKCYCLIN